ncbi:hypothetical protein [Roseateles sp.]|uniref:hypothetical protein n=1 Tax=Roseateles sp. TaxID=1971397 RepID=UPI003BAD017E
MIPKLDDLKDRTKYKRLLKTELQAVKANPEVWVLFDKFQFNDKVAPLLLVGDMASKVPFDAVKDTDAPIKGKGKSVTMHSRRKTASSNLWTTSPRSSRRPPRSRSRCRS